MCADSGHRSGSCSLGKSGGITGHGRTAKNVAVEQAAALVTAAAAPPVEVAEPVGIEAPMGTRCADGRRDNNRIRHRDGDHCSRRSGSEDSSRVGYLIGSNHRRATGSFNSGSDTTRGSRSGGGETTAENAAAPGTAVARPVMMGCSGIRGR